MVILRADRRDTLFSRRLDLVNMLWTPRGEGLLYAVSPIYDTPGIYLFDARTLGSERVVKPTNRSDPAYPEGADWFVLCSVAPLDGRSVVLRYLHFRHVDSVDFRNFPYDAPQRIDTLHFAR